jgi:hypothetical protein
VVGHSIIGASVHDARIVAQMTVWKVDTTMTLNSADFRRFPGIVVQTPRDLLSAGGSEIEDS